VTSRKFNVIAGGSHDSDIGLMHTFFRTYMHSGLTSQRLLALFCFGFLSLNFPLLGLWDVDTTVLGLPFFPVALMLLWALQIMALAWLMERLGTDDKDD
jgi:hypothetical protein